MKLIVNFSFSIALEGSKPALLTRVSWQRRKRRVKRRDGAICHYCGLFSPDGQVDHIIPLSRGGTDALENLAWACADCNNSKGDRTPSEWQASKEFIEAQESNQGDRIRQLDADGLSGREIEQRVFGHVGGAAYRKVKEVLGTD